MAEDIVREVENFLEDFTAEELLRRGVLQRNGESLQLRGLSVSPLLALMRKYEITRLEAISRSWWLNDEGYFCNPKSDEQPKEGHVDQLGKRGNVFNLQNEFINPYFKKKYHIGQEESGFSDDASFGLEKHLQKALRANIEQLELGLQITDGGTERTVEAGRIDITAEDAVSNLVVIELKAGRAEYESVCQLLSYMGSIENPQEKPIRGILVANDFHPRTLMAAKPIPNISLRAYSYSIQFTFEDRGAP